MCLTSWYGFSCSPFSFVSVFIFCFSFNYRQQICYWSFSFFVFVTLNHTSCCMLIFIWASAAGRLTDAVVICSHHNYNAIFHHLLHRRNYHWDSGTSSAFGLPHFFQVTALNVKKRNVLPETCGPMSGANLRFLSFQRATILHCEITDTGA